MLERRCGDAELLRGLAERVPFERLEDLKRYDDGLNRPSVPAPATRKDCGARTVLPWQGQESEIGAVQKFWRALGRLFLDWKVLGRIGTLFFFGVLKFEHACYKYIR